MNLEAFPPARGASPGTGHHTLVSSNVHLLQHELIWIPRTALLRVVDVALGLYMGMSDFSAVACTESLTSLRTELVGDVAEA